MFWIALCPSREDERTAWSWHALQFTPRVAWLDEALVLEVSACERLWGGRKRLLRKFFEPAGDRLVKAPWAMGPTARVALGVLRVQTLGLGRPLQVPEDLPLEVLSAASDHGDTLERVGCRTWGDLRRLPRSGVSRRFGQALVRSLDLAWGDQPETFEWLTLPETFDFKVELPALATSAGELMWSGQRLLSLMQLWLQARHRGVLAFELEWTLDLKRLDGKRLAESESLQVRTSQPTQEMAHLRRLLNEHLSRTTISAPANALRLRTIETSPWGGLATSLLPEDNRTGDKLHQFVERLSVRLGEHNVSVPRLLSDHRPERMQQWVPARGAPPAQEPAAASEALYPAWLLKQPLRLQVRGNVPCYGGPLRRLRQFRIETGWWEAGGPALRDYFIARSEQAGWVWIYRERALQGSDERWFLQGLYA